MKPTGCNNTERIVRSAASGGLTREQEEHAAACPECGQALAVARWMDRIATVSLPLHELAPANQVWVRAQFERQQEARRQILRPISVLNGVAYLLAAVGPAVWITWKWPVIRALLTELQRGHFAMPDGGFAALSWSLVWMVGGVLAMLSLLTLHFLEE